MLEINEGLLILYSWKYEVDYCSAQINKIVRILIQFFVFKGQRYVNLSSLTSSKYSQAHRWLFRHIHFQTSEKYCRSLDNIQQTYQAYHTYRWCSWMQYVAEHDHPYGKYGEDSENDQWQQRRLCDCYSSFLHDIGGQRKTEWIFGVKVEKWRTSNEVNYWLT